MVPDIVYDFQMILRKLFKWNPSCIFQQTKGPSEKKPGKSWNGAWPASAQPLKFTRFALGARDFF